MQKNLRREKAQKHTETMDRLYAAEIKKCVDSTRLYDWGFKRGDISGSEARFFLEKSFTQDSVMKNTGKGKVAVLNFASFRHPGGGFLNGSMAQEEAICHASFLYNVLREFKDYYEWNKVNCNKGLYMNRALFSPNIFFFDEKDSNPVAVDVITCAAPNRSMLIKDGRFNEKENEEALRDRIRFIRDICDSEDVDILIAGAFGCGAFAQKPEVVAKCFREYFSDTTVTKVIFAVPPDRNYPPFENEFRIVQK